MQDIAPGAEPVFYTPFLKNTVCGTRLGGLSKLCLSLAHPLFPRPNVTGIRMPGTPPELQESGHIQSVEVPTIIKRKENSLTDLRS